MATDTENPYANYLIDDWNWEFLRRNRRHRRAYKAVQWVIARPSKWRADWDSKRWGYGLYDGRSGPYASCEDTLLARAGLLTDG